MKKTVAVCSIVILVLEVAIGWWLIKENQPKQDVSLIDKIAEAPCAKFESCNSNDKCLFITSEIKTLSDAFSSLDIVNSEKPVSDWIYRITFNCKELTMDGQEIVVLIGTEAMSINGESCCTPEGVPFESVVELFESKYNYFADS